MTRQSQLDAILAESWERYAQVMYVQTLGSCIRQVCQQMQSPEHSILDKLNGSVAITYFEQKYVEEKSE